MLSCRDPKLESFGKHSLGGRRQQTALADRQQLSLDLKFQRLCVRILRGGRGGRPQQRAAARLDRRRVHYELDFSKLMVSNGVTRCVLEELTIGCDCSLLWLTTTPTTKDPCTKPLEVQVQGESLSALLATSNAEHVLATY